MRPVSRCRCAVLWLCLMAMAGYLSAQRLPFRVYGPNEGLANLNVSSIAQDRQGFLWVGTQNGVFRYDGRRFHRYDRNHGLPSSAITAVFEGMDGTLWVGTRAGLCRLEDQHFVLEAATQYHAVSGSGAIAESAGGELYVGTSRGLLVRSGKHWRPVTDQPAVGVRVTSAGVVWFGCGTNLCRLERERVEEVGPALGLPPQRWDAIESDLAGSLWVRSRMRIFELPKGHERFLERPGLPPGGLTGTLCLDINGTLIAPTDLGLAMRLRGGWKVLTRANGLPSDTTETCFRDREDSLWIGHSGLGLARLLGNGEWKNWTAVDALANDVIWAIKRDTQGKIWLGTDAGVLSKERGERRWKLLRLRADGGKVRALAVAPNGSVFAGLGPGGIVQVDADSVVNPGPALPEHTIFGLFFDKSGRLWASTDDGLFAADPGTQWSRFERQFPPGPKREELFHRCAQDRDGRIWAPGSHGVALWQDGRWTRLTRQDGLRTDLVRSVAAGPDGSVWLAYADSFGITRVRLTDGAAPEMSHYNRQNGMESDLAYFVGFDRAGALWAGTENGIDVYRQGKWMHISRDDGLVWSDCNTNAFLADDDGSVWIGTSRGLSHYRNTDWPVPAEPNLVLTSIRAHRYVQEASGELRLPFRHNAIQFALASPTFRHESRVRFEHRLVGLSDDWIAGTDWNVGHERLPAGKYIFEARARLPHVEPRLPALRVPFSIERAWWQTWWSLLAVFVALLLLARGMWHWRIAVLLRREQTLEAAVAERTQQLTAEKAMLMIAREALHQMATTDDLTRIWNRRAILDFLERETVRAGREGTPLSVILLDIDHFKIVNDTFGHAVGDRVLQSVTRSLSEAIRAYDGVGRYGGEEIMLVLPGCLAEEALERAEELRRLLQSLEVQADDLSRTLRITCSAGVAWMAPGTETSTALMAAADRALYAAKRNGRNRVEGMARLASA